ncbi:MAG: ClpXP protease specificity-enhancing factor [Gammaproteobacteria bacterium]
MENDRISRRPYLCRALHEWITDSGQTPYIVVDACHDRTVVPAEYIEDGRIVLNISNTATHNLIIGNDAVTFQARFGGTPFDVSIPAPAVLAIYGRETGEGMIFADQSTPAEDGVGGVASSADDGDRPNDPDRSHLRVVK